jgi:nucleotide-binding universal stress UspA family protein
LSVPGRERIVVGVDGSDLSKRALLWAHREAALRGTELHVIHVMVADDELSEGARFDSFVQSIVGDDGSVAIETRIVGGPPAQALIHAAENADLAVVGSQGRRGYGGMRLGSVSQQVADHASCPVVIVR